MKNYVINLKRQPEKFERFSKLNAGSGIAFERFEASDGGEMSEQEAVSAKVIAPGTRLTKGAIGCGASHQRIWKEMAQAGAPALVFEDDAIVRNDVTETVSALLGQTENWDILVLGGRLHPQIPDQGIRSRLSEIEGTRGGPQAQSLLRHLGLCGLAARREEAPQILLPDG